MRPQRLIIPGLFLLVLALGNLIVGSYRATQHREIISELTATPPISNESQTSLLMRAQLKEFSNQKYFAQHRLAEQRLNFYTLVEFGGLMLLALSVVLLGWGVFALFNLS